MKNLSTVDGANSSQFGKGELGCSLRKCIFVKITKHNGRHVR